MTRITAIPKDDAMCGWYHTAPPRQARPTHHGEKQTRWAVLGAGFTGLAVERQLALNFPED